MKSPQKRMQAWDHFTILDRSLHICMYFVLDVNVLTAKLFNNLHFEYDGKVVGFGLVSVFLLTLLSTFCVK